MKPTTNRATVARGTVAARILIGLRKWHRGSDRGSGQPRLDTLVRPHFCRVDIRSDFWAIVGNNRAPASHRFIGDCSRERFARPEDPVEIGVRVGRDYLLC
jgi:hypothetical protein